jgi:apolipoprotein N-acyltransferase
LVSPFVDDVSDFSAGERIDNHVIRGVTLAPVICFELLSDSLVRKAAQNSDALVVQTNSATFAGTAESAQQLNITRIRAMENAREIVSVSTIGISAHIDINGRVTQKTKEDVRAVLQGEIQGVSNQSVASRLGGLATPLALLVSFFPLVLHRIRRP